ncbi:MAG TPA: hypothetical protein VMT17_13620 [Anaeromyxobacteraceae bacterium]|nr:hypothetical protein [Anaeromyxobacteraceae bacterium]
MTRTICAAFLALAIAPALARAELDDDVPLIRKGLGSYSVVGAEVNTGRPFVDVQGGWPSTTFGYTLGLSPTSDIGFRLGLLYGYEGTTASQFGLSLYAPLRFELPGSKDFHWLVHVDPGLKLYTESTAAFGIQFPVGLVLGFPLQHGLEAGLGVDFEMTLLFTGAFSPRFTFGPMAGPYLEYHPRPEIAVGVNTRFGAAIQALSSYQGVPGGTQTSFAFVTQAFVGYRL